MGRLRSVETNHFRRCEVREFSCRPALVSFAPSAAWQISWQLFSALHHPSQNTKFREIYIDLRAPENVLVIEVISIMINRFQIRLRTDIFTAHRSRAFCFIGSQDCSGWKGLRSSSGPTSGSEQGQLWGQGRFPGALASLVLKTIHFPHKKRTRFRPASELQDTWAHHHDIPTERQTVGTFNTSIWADQIFFFLVLKAVY